MKKEDLERLILEMAGASAAATNRKKMDWDTFAEAELIDDPAMYEELITILNAHTGEDERPVRTAVCFAYGRLLKNAYDAEACRKYLGLLNETKESAVIGMILDRVAELELGDDMDASPIVEIVKNGKWLARYLAIRALGAFGSELSRKTLHEVLEMDPFEHKDEVECAIGALAKIADPEDIDVLQPLTQSACRDIADLAFFSILTMKRTQIAS